MLVCTVLLSWTYLFTTCYWIFCFQILLTKNVSTALNSIVFLCRKNLWPKTYIHIEPQAIFFLKTCIPTTLFFYYLWLTGIVMYYPNVGVFARLCVYENLIKYFYFIKLVNWPKNCQNKMTTFKLILHTNTKTKQLHVYPQAQ